ncbi:MAG TPA: preprotein translocase subunit SecG [Phycisphaerae bacterium]|nr:preprotein translocase subunit SecG [Phycisphaerae bacterium]HUT58152.1 preprotein translocase subunit SecG [Phycisphaerae bacterium]
MDTFLLTLFLVICILMVIVILLQKGRGGGLGAAFGGAGSSAFGTRTGDVFTWVTIVLTALFLLLGIATTLVCRPEKEKVQAPTFDPLPGAITGQVGVTITVPRAKEGTQIFYTTDGTEPTEYSAEYLKNAIPVQPGQTLRARALRRGSEPSRIVTGFYGRPEDYPPETQPATLPATTPATASQPTTQPASAPLSTVPASAPRTTQPVE